MISYAFPGGYPVYYICEDGGILCPKCASQELVKSEDDPQWNVIDFGINYEDAELYCDDCYKKIVGIWWK